VISVVLALVASGSTVAMNVQGYHHPGFFDEGSPFADPWSPDPRTEYGWPLTFLRHFDEPSEINAAGKVDVFSLGIDIVFWCGMLAACFLPAIVVGSRKAKGAGEGGQR